MTVSTTAVSQSFTGNGVTTSFSITAFTYRSADDLVVTVAGVETDAYSVVGGAVVFVSAPANAAAVVVSRVTLRTQPAVYASTERFPAASHEAQLDRLTMVDQEQQSELDGHTDRLDDVEDRTTVLEEALPEVEAGYGLLIATQAEAEGGTNVNKTMNPLRTKQSVTVELDAVYDDIEAQGLTVATHATRLTALEDVVDSGSYNGGYVYTTAANATADAAPALNSLALVVADSTASNNGLYRKSAVAASPGWTRVGDLPPTLADAAGPNQFKAGRYPDEAEFLFSTNEVDDTASADLIALGFDRCVVKAAAETSIVYGERLPFALTGNEYYAARVYIQKDSGSANYGVPRLYFYSGGGSTLLGYVAMTLENTISTTAASYTVNGQATSTYAGADLIAVGTAVSTGTGLGVMGGQFHISPRRVQSVPLLDYPVEGDNNEALLPDTFWLCEGEKIPLYVPNLMKRRFPDDETVMGFMSTRASDNYPFCVTGDRELIIDPDLCGADAIIDYRPKVRDFDRRRRSLPALEIAPASGLTGTRKVLMIGDSLSNRGQAFIVDERVAAAGRTLTWQGTVTGQNRAGSATGKLGECREGKSLQDFVSVSAGMTNVGVGDVATYNALTNTNKMGYNPFNDGSGFDFPNYVTRFLSGTNPDDVIIGLGTNDITQQSASSTATFLANFEACFDIMQTSIRSAGAGIRIGWWLPTQPRSKTGDQRWATKHFYMIQTLMAKVRALADANTHVIPVWAHMSQEVGWDLDSTPAEDATTGTQHAHFSDVTHFSDGTLREQVSMPIANFLKAA